MAVWYNESTFLAITFMHELVFDIETKNTFEEVGSSDPRALSISVVCVYNYADDQYTSYREEELPKLWPLVDNADRIIGFNSIYFDMPLLEKYAGRSFAHVPHLDLLVKVKDSLGHRLKLDDIAKATLNVQKSGHGLQAVQWYKEGNWESIIKYCIDDVRITKDVYEFAKKNHQLFYPDFSGIRPFPVEVEQPLPRSLAPATEPVTVQQQMSLW